MWIEATRIGFVVVGGLVAAALAVAPRVGARLYARAMAGGRVHAAGVWAFLVAGGGRSAPR